MVWLVEQGFCSQIGISLKITLRVLFVRPENAFVEPAVVVLVCQLVLFENLIATSNNRCVLTLLMVSLNRITAF